MRRFVLVPPEGYLLVGEAVKPQGIHGEVRINPSTDTPETWLGITSVGFYDKSGEWSVQQISYSRVQQEMVVAKIAGIEDRNAVEALRGTCLYAHRDILAPLIGDRYFLVDLIGCKVEDETGHILGHVTEVMQPGANDVYVIQGETGEILLPAIAPLVLDICVSEKKIVVNSRIVQEVAVYED